MFFNHSKNMMPKANTQGGFMFPRQLWMSFAVTTCCLLQANGWTFPKTGTKLQLPIDFPTSQAFYQVVILPESADELRHNNSGPIGEFSVRKSRIHLQGDGQSSFYKKQMVEIDSRNGSLWLIRNPTDFDFYKTKNAGKKVLIAVITVQYVQNKKTDIQLEFTGFMSSFCRPSNTTCFPSSPIQYRISEGSPAEVVFDYLLNLGFRNLCPETEVEYNLTSESNNVGINATSGALLLVSPLDAEDAFSISFKAVCRIRNETFEAAGKVSAIDTNDNPPTTQSGNTSDTVVRHLKPGESFVIFSVNVVDKDSRGVNDLVANIENDTLSLFSVVDTMTYDKAVKGTGTFFSAEIQSMSALYFPEKEYNFTVVFEDKAFPHEDRKVIYFITLINDTEAEHDLKDIYELNISRNAAQFSRIIQLTKSPYTYSFGLDFGEKNFDWIGITKSTGTVYVRDPRLAPGPSVSRRNVIWSTKNETDNRRGSILLVLTIQDDASIQCDNNLIWCAYNENRDSCLKTCAAGSRSGQCFWKPGQQGSLVPTPDYATCSPDVEYCPDGQCDEVEMLDPKLCPQDCAKKFTGEVLTQKSGRGIHSAVGTCFCKAVDRCICLRHYPPEEMRLSKSAVSTLSPITEIRNESLLDQGKLFIETLGEEATSVGMAVDGVSCGTGCILLACMIPLGLFILILVVMVTRKIRSSRINKHKFVSSHISLSGVPSDYVDDRSNSVQDSRPSDTSSLGKSSMDTRWEFPRNKLQLQSLLGEGEFGKVMKALAWNIDGAKGYTTVAVKMLKENGGTQERQDLVSEFTLLKEISHPNVIRLLGASTERSGPFYLIVEYAEMGSLRSYLRKRRRHNNCCRYNGAYGQGTPQETRDYYKYPCERSRREPNHSFFHREQLSFAWQIAKGMAYLSDMKLIHRDLAARNVLLAKQKVLKISDFGLSRDIYEGDNYLKRSKGRVPVKWMAIESLEDQVYTTRSDVWSFGVVLWEILMQGATPYPGVTPQRLYNLLKAGYRMSKPDFCPDEMYLLMRQCWRVLPRERPSFKELVLKLDFLLQDTVEYMDFVSKERIQRTPCSVIQPSQIPAPEIQYTSVLQENDEDEVSDEDSNENIGLVTLFDRQHNSPRTGREFPSQNEPLWAHAT